jgi:hypothetical protein
VKTGFLGFVLSGLLFPTLLAVGCIRVVAVDAPALDPGALAAHRSFVLLVNATEGSPDAPLEALREEALEGLVKKGYRESDDGTLLIEVIGSEDRVRRRTMTPDPGYSAYAMREREEAVVLLRLSASGTETDLWRGAARVRLPDEGLLIGPDREAAWRRAVVELVDRLPERAGR